MGMNWFVAAAAVCLVGAAQSANDLCGKVGPRCKKDGKEIEFCAEVGKEPISVEQCENGLVCKDDKDGVRCAKPETTGIRFECTGKGEFPDPMNCSQTYICTAGTGAPAEVCACPKESYVYPTRNLFCVPDQCPRNDIIASEGSHGFFTLKNGQKTEYYYYFEKAKVVKVYENVEGVNVESDKPAFKVIKNNKKCVPYKTPVDGNVICKTTSDIFPTECDCDFIYCDRKLQPIRISCHKGYRYSVERKTCVSGDCDESKCTNRPRKLI